MIPVPIIASLSMFEDHVIAWVKCEGMVAPLMCRMIDNDPTRLEPAQ